MKHLIPLLLLFVFAGIICAHAQTGGPSFQVTKTGNGRQSIVLIPGFACSGDVWKETVALYSPHYTCYVLTMPGFAGAPPEKTPALEGWVSQIAGFIREEHLQKPVVVGHSLGGVMALMLAGRYPDLIGKIVVVDALPCLPALMNPAFVPAADPGCDTWGAQFRAIGDSVFYQQEKQGMLQLLADTSRLAEIVDWGVRSDRRTLGDIYCQLSNLDLRDSLHPIVCPALIMLEAPFAKLRPAIEMQYKGLAQGSIHYATKGLHFIMYDDPQWYRNELTDFLPL